MTEPFENDKEAKWENLKVEKTDGMKKKDNYIEKGEIGSGKQKKTNLIKEEAKGIKI